MVHLIGILTGKNHVWTEKKKKSHENKSVYTFCQIKIVKGTWEVGFKENT